MANRNKFGPRDCEGMTQEEMIRDLWKAFYGDHSEERPGLMLRIDRLESKVAMAVWAFVLAAGTAITTGVGWLFAHASYLFS